MTAEAPSISPVVDDGDLKDVLRALVGEINRLNSRVDSLSSDNRLLRFELTQINQQLNRASPRDQMERRAALYSELALTPHSDDAAPTDAPAGGTHEERMVALEQRLNNLETHTAEPSGRKDGALVFAKCLSCQKPSASKRETSPDPRVLHGRPFVQRRGASPTRPDAAPQGSFRLDITKGHSQNFDLHDQKLPGQGEGAAVHVGRRSGSFGVEKIRPRTQELRNPVSRS